MDEFDALLNDDDDSDDEGPMDLEAHGLVGVRNGGNGGNGGSGGSKGGVGEGAPAVGGGERSSNHRRSTKHKKYANYSEQEKEDEEFQEAFGVGDGEEL